MLIRRAQDDTISNVGSLKNQISWRTQIFRIGLSVCVGLLAGLSASLFLSGLGWVTQTREHHSSILWALPAAGFFIGWIYHRWGREIADGMSFILNEIYDPQKPTPVLMAPLILIGTLVTHLFGGSAGREGTAVQMGASLADQLTRFFRVSVEERRALLRAGAGAGFGAAIGAPWAGMIFGMEFSEPGKLKWSAWRECFVASMVGYSVTLLLGTHHTPYLSPEIPTYSLSNGFWVATAGVLFGLTALAYKKVTHLVERFATQGLRYPPLRPLVGGLLLAVLFHLEGSYRYTGLGIPYIQEALTQEVSFLAPLLKSLFTSLTVGTGFKGGEFIPLVYVGATLGSALSALLPIGLPLLSQVGFAAVFAGAANTPLACTVMAMEIFDWRIGGFAFLACGLSFLCSGSDSVYKSQRNSLKKFFGR